MNAAEKALAMEHKGRQRSKKLTLAAWEKLKSIRMFVVPKEKK